MLEWWWTGGDLKTHLTTAEIERDPKTGTLTVRVVIPGAWPITRRHPWVALGWCWLTLWWTLRTEETVLSSTMPDG